jgi:hypothetical protein
MGLIGLEGSDSRDGRSREGVVKSVRRSDSCERRKKGKLLISKGRKGWSCETVEREEEEEEEEKEEEKGEEKEEEEEEDNDDEKEEEEEEDGDDDDDDDDEEEEAGDSDVVAEEDNDTVVEEEENNASDANELMAVIASYCFLDELGKPKGRRIGVSGVFGTGRGELRGNSLRTEMELTDHESA